MDRKKCKTMNKLHFTPEQVTKVLQDIAQRNEGYSMVMKIAFEAMMRAERQVHNETHGDVSRLFNEAKEEVRQWIERPLDSYYPIIYIDATFIPVRRNKSVPKEAFTLSLGAKPTAPEKQASVSLVFYLPGL